MADPTLYPIWLVEYNIFNKESREVIEEEHAQIAAPTKFRAKQLLRMHIYGATPQKRKEARRIIALTIDHVFLTDEEPCSMEGVLIEPEAESTAPEILQEATGTVLYGYVDHALQNEGHRCEEI